MSRMMDRMAAMGWSLSMPLLISVAEQDFGSVGAIDAVLAEALNIDLRRVRDTITEGLKRSRGVSVCYWSA